jgi:hypothetical protein
VNRESGSAGQPERDSRRRAEELVSEHVTGQIAAPLATYLQAVQERADAQRRIASAEEAMRGAVQAMRALPGLSDEVVARLIQADPATVRRLVRRQRGARLNTERPARV